MKSRVLLALACAFALAGLFFYTQVQAQEQRGLAASPPVLELAANPGERITQNIRIENLTEISQTISIDIRSFRALGEEGQPELIDDDTPNSLATWISVSPDSVSLPGRESEIFTITIDVPTNAPPGGHYSSIVFRTTATPLAGQTGVAIGQEIGTLALLRVSGDIEEKLAIESFTSPKGFWQHGPVELETRLNNSGNVHIRPGGNVTITNIFGRTVAILPLEAKNVLPDSIRRFENSWDQKWLWGRYTATVSVVYGSENTLTSATIPLWGFSVAVVGGGAALLLVLGTLIFLGRQRLGRAFRIILGKE